MAWPQVQPAARDQRCCGPEQGAADLANGPFDAPQERDARIRARAHQLWEEQGRPEGREADLLEQAEDLIALEESGDAALRPNPMNDPHVAREGVDEADIQDNYGEFPDRFTDQGERRQTPTPRRRTHKE
jgi:Protein of unknown function (DUF2934)